MPTSASSPITNSTTGVFKELFLNPGSPATYENLSIWAKNAGQERFAKLAEEAGRRAEDTEAEFNRLCIGPYKLIVIPYETAWVGKSPLLNGAVAADVSDFYAMAGLSSCSQLNEFSDYFGNEIEFVYFLEQLETQHSGKVAREIRGLLDSFRTSHFDRWFAPFLTALSDNANLEFWKEAALILKQHLQNTSPKIVAETLNSQNEKVQS